MKTAFAISICPDSKQELKESGFVRTHGKGGAYEK